MKIGRYQRKKLSSLNTVKQNGRRAQLIISFHDRSE